MDPAWIALGGAALLLLLAISWLMGGTSERAQPPAPIAAAPSGPSPLDAALARLTAAEAALAELGARPPGDPPALAGLDRHIAEARTAAAQSLAAVETAIGARFAEGMRARDTAEQALAARIEAVAEQHAQRLAAAEQALGGRMSTTEQARSSSEQNLTQRMSTLEAAIAQRLTILEQGLAQRLAPLEEALRRVGAAEARTERLAAIDALRSLLDAGRPLGPALPRLGPNPPEALVRFATQPPPTEPALRLALEETLRQARAAQGEGLMPRLNALLTIRRGDEVVWGDASEAQIERARRALEAGDLDAALAQIGRLPEANRAALRGWIAEAEALAAARAALRALSQG